MEEKKASARIRVEASAEEVEGIDDDANNFTRSSWMFFVENSAMNASVFRGMFWTPILTRLSFGDHDPASLKDLFQFVHLQVLVGIARLGTRGDQRFLHRKLDHERLGIINSLSQGNGRKLPRYWQKGRCPRNLQHLIHVCSCRQRRHQRQLTWPGRSHPERRW